MRVVYKHQLVQFSNANRSRKLLCQESIFTSLDSSRILVNLVLGQIDWEASDDQKQQCLNKGKDNKVSYDLYCVIISSSPTDVDVFPLTDRVLQPHTIPAEVQQHTLVHLWHPCVQPSVRIHCK